MVQGNLANVCRHVFDLPAIPFLGRNQLGEEVDGGVSNVPVQSVENVHFHLREHAGIVKSAAHVVELIDLGDSILLVSILGGDQKGGATNELIVLLVNDTLGAVAIEKVDGEEERFGQERKGSVGLDKEIDKVRAHEPLDLALHVDEVSIG